MMDPLLIDSTAPLSADEEDLLVRRLAEAYKAASLPTDGLICAKILAMLPHDAQSSFDASPQSAPRSH